MSTQPILRVAAPVFTAAAAATEGLTGDTAVLVAREAAGLLIVQEIQTQFDQLYARDSDRFNNVLPVRFDFDGFVTAELATIARRAAVLKCASDAMTAMVAAWQSHLTAIDGS